MPNKIKTYAAPNPIEVTCPYCHRELIFLDKTANIKIYCKCSKLNKIYVIDCCIPKAYKSKPMPRNPLEQI